MIAAFLKIRQFEGHLHFILFYIFYFLNNSTDSN